MNRKFGIILIFAGILCIIGAIGIILYNEFIDLDSQEKSNVILNKIKDILPKENMDSDLKELFNIKIDENYYIGFIKIPKINIELPVAEDCDYKKLKIAPCRYYGSIQTNDLIIAGHNYISQFGKISKLDIDDKIIFTDVNGTAYNYSVNNIEMLDSNATLKMINSEYDLTLYTCNTGATKRITIRCLIDN